MYGFTFWKNNDKINETEFIENYITIHKKINPFVNIDQKYYIKKVNKYNIFYFQPQDSKAIKLIHLYESSRYFVFFWGQLFNSEDNYAKYIIDKLERDKSIENLNGNYSFILLNKESDIIEIYSDFIGRRKLFFCNVEDEFAVTNLDHLLVPFLSGSITFDKISIASSLYFDWSVAGKSFLSQIMNTNPDSILQYEKGKITLREVKYDLSSKAITFDEIIDNYTDYLDNFIRNKELVHIDLTAGFDTRTILALLLGKFKKKIVSFTLGKSGMDFNVARKIAKHFNIQHKSSSIEFSDADDFILHSRFLALCMNGDANSIRTLDKIYIDYHAEIPKIIGVYGSIKYGKYTVGDIEYDHYKELMLKNKYKIGFFSDQLLDSLKSRLYNYLDELKSTYNVRNQEIYYIRERCGNWGSMVFNSTWNLRHISPFEDIIAMQNMLSLPKNIRRKTKVQHEILRKFSTFLYLYPMNRNPFNNDYLSFIPDKLRLFIRKAWTHYESKIEQIISSNIKDISTLRLEKYHEYFSECVKPMLERQNSLNKQVLTKENRDELIRNFEKNKVGVLQISQLYTMELWKDIIDKFSIIKRDDYVIRSNNIRNQ